MQCWRDFDRRFFSLPREDRGAAIAMAKDEIIAKINADFQKLYFGKKANGTVVDVELMTYAEVALRMAELMYVLPSQERATDRNPASTPDGRWIDITFKSRVFKFLQMTEARFSDLSVSGSAFCTSDAMLDVKPTEVITEFLANYPAANTQLLQQQDIDFFLQICKVGGKPVPFIPVIDESLSVWFKKDSLWYSEDLAAVPERDAGRVCCLQGPVAVTHATKVNEPAREILDNMNNGIIDYVLNAQGVARDSAKIPTVDVLWSPLDSAGYDASSASTITVEYDAVAIAAAAAAAAEAEESGATASHQQWYERVVKSAATIGCASWLRAALLAEDVVDRKKWVANPLRRLLAPARGQTLVLGATQGQVTSLKVFSSATKKALDEASVTFEAQPLSTSSTASTPIVVTIIDRPPAEDGSEQPPVTLELRMLFNPLTPAMPLQWSQKEMSDDLREFYRALWSLDPSAFDDTADESVRRGTCALSKAKVAALNGAVGQPTSAYAAVAVNAEAEAIKSQWVTTDAAITIAWKPMMECLLMQVGASLKAKSYRCISCDPSHHVTRSPVTSYCVCHCAGRRRQPPRPRAPFQLVQVAPLRERGSLSDRL